jgi:uroporphyrin-3 C-methyltransferase
MTDTPASKEPKIIDATVVRTRPGFGGNRWFWAVLLFALLLLGGVVGSYYQSTHAIREQARHADAALADVRSQLTAMQRQIEQASEAIRVTEQVRQDVDRRLSDADAKHAALAEELRQSFAALAQTQIQTDEGWVLREVHFLLIVAEQRLHLERDVQTAVAAIESADRRLGESNDPTLIPIREQLIADLNALRALPSADVSGMTLTLANLIERVDTLPLKGGDIETAKEGRETAPAPDAAAASGTGWRGALQRIWGDLVSLVDVKSLDVPYDIIFDPGRRYLLQQNLRLELAAARLEVLRHDSANLRATLQRIDTLLDRYYDTQSAEIVAMREALAPMQQVELAPALPSLDRSLDMVRARMQAAAGQVATEPPAP